MKKVLKHIWNVLQVLIIIYVILITAFIFCENKYGFTQFGSYTFNNVDSIGEKNINNVKDGDLLVIKSDSNIKKGDTVYYYAAYKEKYIIVSNVVTSINKDGKNKNYSVGKENKAIISDTKVIGKDVSIYHNIGKVLSVLESRTGFIFLVLLPIMIVFIYQLYQFLLLIRADKLKDLGINEDKEIL